MTADDVKKPMPDSEAFRTALWELGIPAENALAITGSASGLRAATSAGLAWCHHGRRCAGNPRRRGGAARLRGRRAAADVRLQATARPLVRGPQAGRRRVDP